MDSSKISGLWRAELAVVALGSSAANSGLVTPPRPSPGEMPGQLHTGAGAQRFTDGKQANRRDYETCSIGSPPGQPVNRINQAGKRWLMVGLYALAMAWVEAAAVYYLRTLVNRIDP